jgi:hypothetical protein
VRVDTRDGTLLVSAKDVVGPLRWRPAPEQDPREFSNADTCLVGSKAKNCTFGAPGTPERITPPPLCTIHLVDDVGECGAFIKNCTPGERPGGLATLVCDLALVAPALEIPDALVEQCAATCPCFDAATVLAASETGCAVVGNAESRESKPTARFRLTDAVLNAAEGFKRFAQCADLSTQPGVKVDISRRQAGECRNIIDTVLGPCS